MRLLSTSPTIQSNDQHGFRRLNLQESKTRDIPEYQDPKLQVASPIVPTSASPEDLHRKLAFSLKSPAATLAEVKANLQALRPWLVRLDSKKRHSEAIKYLAGAKTLRWAWDKNLPVSLEFLNDDGLIETLALFLVAEKMDQFMSDWLLVDVPGATIDTLGKTALTWRARLYRHLVGAELTLAERGEKSVDAAITRLFAIQNERVKFPLGSPQERMSAWPALLRITSLATSADCSRTNVKLYDRLMGLMKCYDGFKAEDIPVVTLLSLWHPKRPDASPFVTSLRHVRDRGSNSKPSMCNNPRGRTSLLRYIDRALQLLDLPHQQADREWLQRTRTQFETEFAQAWQVSTNRQYMRGVKWDKPLS